MFTVPISKYPENKEWDKKINSTPSIPGGKNQYLSNLRKLLLYVQNGEPLEIIPQLDGSNSKITLNELCLHQLGPMKFVSRTNNGGWTLSEEATLWIESEDNLYLATLFCANVKFFSEILYYLDSPKTARELFDIAVNEYDLSWKIPTTINNRLIWLRQFGFVEFQEFSLLYNITPNGQEFLKSVNYVLPDSISFDKDTTLSENEITIDEPFLVFFSENNQSIRKTGFGYFPGKKENIESSICGFLSQIKNDGRIDEINQFAYNEYKIKDSSARSALSTLESLGLIARKTNISYCLTDLGYIWMESKDILSLLPLFQLRILFFFEILLELEQTSHSYKELALISKLSYGFDKENISEITNRVKILLAAKLIMKVSAEKFVITNRGKLLLDKYGSFFCVEKKENEKINTPSEKNLDIISNLRMASKDSFNPDKFEMVVRDYFEIIGFDAEWLGGSGKTDVLLKTSDSPFDSFVVSVDAKSTSSKTVTDNLVDFDTLKEHKKIHKSDYIAIVGRAFNERLIRRAKEHNVVLFTVDTLEKLLSIHNNTPQKLSTLKKLFNQAGLVDLSVLNPDIDNSEKKGYLIVSIMNYLIKECGDPVTNGKLTERDLYRSLRSDDKISKINDTNEIKDALDFLSSPIIDCVKKDKDSYYATGSLNDMARILSFLKDKFIQTE